jgi:hypothetical protein
LHQLGVQLGLGNDELDAGGEGPAADLAEEGEDTEKEESNEEESEEEEEEEGEEEEEEEEEKTKGTEEENSPAKQPIGTQLAAMRKGKGKGKGKSKKPVVAKAAGPLAKAAQAKAKGGKGKGKGGKCKGAKNGDGNEEADFLLVLISWSTCCVLWFL